MASAVQEYIEKYADAAMEQQRLYGIPASITLAQGILESASGQSQLARNENNHFGVKASQSWINNGGKYALYTDDKPNEKFCTYASASDSYAHHSQFLKNNSRYAACFNLAADDYKGWANGLQRAGYATDKRYAQSLISLIEKNGLNKYDQMVIANPQVQAKAQAQTAPSVQVPNGEYAFPVKRDEFMLITSPFGQRNDPMNPSQKQMHKGIDIKCNNEAVFATENDGKVVSVNQDANTPGGKSITVEYARADGTKAQNTYMHLSSIDVRVGDTVNANDKIGVSGNTGTRTTGPHLHFGVKQISSDGTSRDVDPAAYLAEIAQKGNIAVTAMHNGSDLLAKYKTTDSQTPAIDTSLSADDWMKKLLSSEDSGVKLGGTGQDPVMEMVMTLFTSLLALATQLDNKSSEEALAAATDAVVNRQIDLSSLVPNQKQCTLTLRDNDTPILQIGNTAHAMTTAEMNRLNLVLSDTSLSNEQKQQKVASVINGIVIGNQLSQNYEQNITAQQSQTETITR